MGEDDDIVGFHHEDDPDVATGDGANILDPETKKLLFVRSKCATCVFRPGNLMHLRPGALARILKYNIDNQTHLTCHQTLAEYGKGLPEAVCRGYRDHPVAKERSLALRFLAIWPDIGRYVDADTGEIHDTDEEDTSATVEVGYPGNHSEQLD